MRTHTINEGGNGEGLAVSNAGDRLYSSCPGNYLDAGAGGMAYNTADLTALGHFPGLADLGYMFFAPLPDGRVVITQEQLNNGDSFSWDTPSLFSTDFVLTSTAPKVQGTVWKLVLSSDAKRLGIVANAGDVTLTFEDLP